MDSQPEMTKNEGGLGGGAKGGNRIKGEDGDEYGDIDSFGFNFKKKKII